MSDFNAWRDHIEKAYTPAPRTYQDAYKAFIDAFGDVSAVDKAAGFHAGWLSACDAMANLLVEWLDAPPSDDVTVFLGFVDQIRKGDLGTSDVQ